MIETSGLTFQYEKTNEVFEFPDLRLTREENLLILGQSGVGKTTFLHLLAGLLKPRSGSVSIVNQNLSSLSSAQLDRFRGKHIGLVFQKNHAIQSLSLIDNLKARLYFSKSMVAKDRISQLLTQLDLLDVKEHKASQLSVGQLQRLAIALAVVHQPSVLLADEPTSSLDDINCKRVIELLKTQAALTKANLIIITHDARVKAYFNKSLSL